MQVRFTISESGYKIPAIKAIREVTGLGLKEAKDAADSGSLTIEPRQIHDLERALRPYAKLTYTAPVSIDSAVQRITAVGTRVTGRLLSKLADRLETLEARIWREAP